MQQRATNGQDDCLRRLESNTITRVHTHSDVQWNQTVWFLLFLIKIRYRITMSSLMEYAEGFKDLPPDSAELSIGCRKAAFHLGSEIQQGSMLHIFEQSQVK